MKQQNTRFIIGLTILFSGVYLILKAAHIEFPLIIDNWWVILILVIALYNMVKNGLTVYSVAMVGFALYYLGRRQGWLPSFFKSSYLFGIAIIVFGFVLMFKDKDLRKEKDYSSRQKRTSSQEEEIDSPAYSTIFASHDNTIEKKLIDGTHTFTLFGESTLDATFAEIEDETMIDVTAIFGEANLFFPPHVNVELKGSPIFGEIKNKRRNVAAGPNAPTVTIRALCLFGEVKIR